MQPGIMHGLRAKAQEYSVLAISSSQQCIGVPCVYLIGPRDFDILLASSSWG